MKELLIDAENNGYAVGAFSVGNMEMIMGVIKAAEETNTPVILQIAEKRLMNSPLELMAPMMVNAAKKAKVKIAVHLDHGQSFETCAAAIKLGFGSVMFDGAGLPFEENVRITAAVTRMAKAMGVDVEAELGKVGDVGKDDDKIDVFTDVEESAAFIEQTGVDALAVAIGNLHGHYVATPKLNIDRLIELRDRNNNLPLVLHGGSGTSIEDFKACPYLTMITKNGIIKKTSLEQYSRPRTNGIIAITIREDDRVISVALTDGDSDIVLANRKGRAVRFNEKTVRPMGRTATGVRGMALDEGDEIVGMVVLNKEVDKNILVLSEQGYGKRSLSSEYPTVNRGCKGVKTINITEKTGALIAIMGVTNENDLMVINKSGIAIRTAVEQIPVIGRATQGVRIIDLKKKNDTISSVCKVSHEVEAENENVDDTTTTTTIEEIPTNE